VAQPVEDTPPTPSALPSVRARVLAFLAILVAGACGGLIGYGVVDVQCTGNCTTARGWGLLTGAVMGTVGVAVIAVLVLRAMGEWRVIRSREQGDDTGEDTDPDEGVR
jgi:hypothetical protein